MPRYPIRFENWYRILSSALLLPPSTSYVEVVDDTVTVRMGWAFRARFERSAVVQAERFATEPLSRGVHGFGGRWLVNGAGDGTLAPAQRAEARAWAAGLRRDERGRRAREQGREGPPRPQRSEDAGP